MLKPEECALLVIDVQGNLAHAMHDKAPLFANIRRLVQGARLFEVPIVWIEQYPEGLGPTIPEIAELIDQPRALSKTSFSCCGAPEIVDELQRLGRRQLLVCGIEAHVCVYQSVIDLLARDYRVEVVRDAVSSRTPENRDLGIRKMLQAGASETSSEMCLFELAGDAGSPRFKALLPLVK